jgi:uncharacterized protein YqfA (UPF0365 family)
MLLAQTTNPGTWTAHEWVWAIVGVLTVIGVVFAIASYGALWLRALLAGCHVSVASIARMKLRGVSPHAVIGSRLLAARAAIPIETELLESHHLARGNVRAVVRALVAARVSGVPMPWERAAAIDLAGRDVLEAVRACATPIVVDCPHPNSHSKTVDAVAKDGIQIKARARVTLRANLERVVGGATEETVVARVAEAMVTAIGSAENYRAVLQRPDLISQAVLAKKLDAGAAFDILSVDVAAVDVGENVTARLSAEQAESDVRVARAKAEERLALAQAREQEMRAVLVESRSKAVLAEADIPRALAQALREGNMGVMDYYHVKNLHADAQMRAAIAGAPAGAEGLPGQED